MHVSGIEDKARKAQDKKALYGTDVDLESYESEAKPQEVVTMPKISPALSRRRLWM